MIRCADIRQRGFQPVQKRMTGFLMRQFPSPEHHRQLDLVTGGQKIDRVAELVVDIMLAREGAKLHLLELGPALVELGRVLLLGLFVLVFAVVHDTADRRHGRGRDFHQIESLRFSQTQRLGHQQDAQLLIFGADHADLIDFDLPVDSRFCGDTRLLSCK